MNLGWACKDGWAHCAICSGERFLGELVLNKQNNVLLLQGKNYNYLKYVKNYLCLISII